MLDVYKIAKRVALKKNKIKKKKSYVESIANGLRKKCNESLTLERHPVDLVCKK